MADVKMVFVAVVAIGALVFMAVDSEMKDGVIPNIDVPEVHLPSIPRIPILNDDTASVPDTTDYDFKVSGSRVYDKAGRSVYSGSDTSAIQWAVDHCPSGGTVVLDRGVFYINDKIWIYRTLVGYGTDTKLVAGKDLDTDTMLEVANHGFSGLSKISVSNIELDGRGATYPTGSYGGIELVQTTYCTLSNLYVHDFPKSHGIEFQASSHNVVKNCRVANIGYGGQYGNGICGGNQIAGKSSTFNTIEDCTITGCSMVGVNWEPGNDNTVRDTVIRSLTSWSGGPTVGISIWDKDSYPGSDNNKFIGCTVDCKGNNVISAGTKGTVIDGCTLTGSTSAAVYANDCSNWAVKNSHITTKGGVGVYFFNSQSMNAIDNDVASSGSDSRGIWIVSNGATSYGNLVASNQVSGFYNGIVLNGAVRSSTVRDNTASGCTISYSIVDGNTVTGNR